MSRNRPISRFIGQPTSALALALALVAAGCAEFETFKAPDVTIANMQVTELTVFETSVAFTLRLANENRDPVAIDGGVFNIYLNGLKIGKGLSDQQFEIPRLGFATQEVTIHISNIALATRIRGLLDSKVFDYRIKGKVYVKRDLGTSRVRIDHQGRLDLNAIDGDASPTFG